MPPENFIAKIDTLDWPAPLYPAALPELRARSRSSSNRRAPSTNVVVDASDQIVNSYDSDSSDDEQADLDNEVKLTLQNQSDNNEAAFQQYLISHRVISAGGANRSSSLARVKSTRPNSKLKYQNNLFDNDYNDYLLRYKSDKEFKKLLEKTSGANKRYHSGGESEDNEIANSIENEENSDELCSPAVKHLESKIKRDIQEISKIEKESSMAAALLQELKVTEK
jgi:hypothetical protein